MALGMILLASGCSTAQSNAHVCDYSLRVENEEYLKSASTCVSGGEYYFSCSCGEKGEQTFFSTKRGEHTFTAEVAEYRYLKTPSNCQEKAVYYKSCEDCGKKGDDSQTFIYGELGDCSYTKKNIGVEYLKETATEQQATEYYFSCACGEKGENTFFYGSPLVSLTEKEKASYQPTSLTVTLYDAETSAYGFTYNTKAKPLFPVLQVQKGEVWTDEYEEYIVEVEEFSSYTPYNGNLQYFVSKSEVKLEYPNKYVYRLYDKYAEVGTEPQVIQARDTNAETFRFAHLSESQVEAGGNSGTGTGVYLGKVLSKTVESNDFILNTGDIVQYSKYEEQWKNMLDTNFQYLSKIPVMTITGNHDVAPYGGAYEIYKHFNNKIPQQPNIVNGYYYSFIYGNTKFIMLQTNNNGDKLSSDQYNWLVDELKYNTCQWTIVAMHNPMYSVGKYGSNPSMNSTCIALRGQLQGLFARYGVDVVLQGHDHAISRTYPIDEDGVAQKEAWVEENGKKYSVNPQGAIYVMNGPVGDQSRKPYGTVDYSLYTYAEESKETSWAEFEISNDRLFVSVKHLEGEEIKVYHEWGIKKTNSPRS